MKRVLLILAATIGLTLGGLLPTNTAEAQRGYRGGYGYGGYRGGVSVNVSPGYGYRSYAYRPYYQSYRGYQPYYRSYNYQPYYGNYGGYYNSYPSYGGGYYYSQPRYSGGYYYGPHAGVYIR